MYEEQKVLENHQHCNPGDFENSSKYGGGIGLKLSEIWQQSDKSAVVMETKNGQSCLI